MRQSILALYVSLALGLFFLFGSRSDVEITVRPQIVKLGDPIRVSVHVRLDDGDRWLLLMTDPESNRSEIPLTPSGLSHFDRLWHLNEPGDYQFLVAVGAGDHIRATAKTQVLVVE